MNCLLRFAGLRGIRGSSRVILAATGKFPKIAGIQLAPRRFTHHDGTRAMGGEREIVGYGINGSPIYIDCPDFPFPAIRYRQPTAEICALREKEQGDWKKLSLEEKKVLYRHSFCQTFAEFQHFTPEWKYCLGVALWFVAFAIVGSAILDAFMYDRAPETFEEERRQAQLRRIIQLQVNPITGISSRWDYSQNKWK